jgi:deazaflavin-dependent oxidoreductase (nitroreductase family)
MAENTNYKAPAKGTNFFNKSMARLAKVGISVYGSRLLCVRGRKTGEWRSVAVNPLTIDGGRYIVSPRGNTQWARNLRAANGEGELRLGRKVERFTATEISDEEKTQVLREYLRRWKFEVGVFFEGVDANSRDEDLRRIAPKHPIFRISPR